MDIEECKETYEMLKKGKQFVANIDKDFFLKFAETVLSELEKKDQEIKQLKSMELKAKYGIASITLEGLINLENGIKKKDKIINEMANKLVEAHSWFYSEFDNFSKEDFIKYFTNKVTEINVGE